MNATLNKKKANFSLAKYCKNNRTVTKNIRYYYFNYCTSF